ncbi:survival motor neuron protein-like [Bombus vosnesenskii]|uniref:Survival motor neuron protein-like n=1 Tax=Bombus vosnesenskii TaxID=207650 RepID=A0A6J3LGL2_9HYME|nr:survival motor neuron protein-like [Bombus vosnesenskii]
MADDMNVPFIRGNGNVCMDTDTANDNVWDDSALIEAYDKAINLAKEEVIKRMGMDVRNSQPKENLQNLKQPKHASKLHKKWIIGAPYRAIYSEDGETYEAIISKIYENTSAKVEMLRGEENWLQWRFVMRTLLEEDDDLLNVCEGNLCHPGNSAEKEIARGRFLKADRLASKLIVTSVGKKPLDLLLCCTTAHEMWKKLNTVYDMKS